MSQNVANVSPQKLSPIIVLPTTTPAITQPSTVEHGSQEDRAGGREGKRNEHTDTRRVAGGARDCYVLGETTKWSSLPGKVQGQGMAAVCYSARCQRAGLYKGPLKDNDK